MLLCFSKQSDCGKCRLYRKLEDKNLSQPPGSKWKELGSRRNLFGNFDLIFRISSRFVTSSFLDAWEYQDCVWKVCKRVNLLHEFRNSEAKKLHLINENHARISILGWQHLSLVMPYYIQKKKMIMKLIRKDTYSENITWKKSYYLLTLSFYFDC